jgi:DNA-binding transcriptional LysR family regulator
MMPAMDARQLEYFVAVAEELNFTRAAERFHVVQSALSSQIARLEREHGVVLFERTSRSVRLAPAGELLLPRARAVLGELRVAAWELAAFTGVVTGQLRLGLVGGVGRTAPVVERSLAAFHRLHPGVDIMVDGGTAPRLADLVLAGRLDTAFVDLSGDQLPGEFVHQPLIDEPLVAVAPRGHHLADVPADLATLAADDAFIDAEADSGLRRQVDLAFRRAGVTRRTALELPTVDAVIRLVALGCGPAVVPYSAVATQPDGIAVLTLSGLTGRYPISVIGPTTPPTPSTRAFIGLLRSPADLDATGTSPEDSGNR